MLRGQQWEVVQEVLVDVSEFVAGSSPVMVPIALTAALDVEAQDAGPPAPLEALLPREPEPSQEAGGASSLVSEVGLNAALIAACLKFRQPSSLLRYSSLILRCTVVGMQPSLARNRRWHATVVGQRDKCPPVITAPRDNCPFTPHIHHFPTLS